jgi:SAM-dependent methyltransferase
MRLDVRHSRLARHVHLSCRARRWGDYVREFPPDPAQRVLDIGASHLVDLPGENEFLRRYPHPAQVTTISNDPLLDPIREAYPGVTALHADALDLPFPDRSFDVVHSNAVIEHVGPAAAQRRFVAEAVRVGKAGFVSTPNRWFPVDSHTNLPFLHWLPRGAFLAALRRLGRLGQDEEWITWLLSRGTLRSTIAPGPVYRLQVQRLAGLPAVITLVFRHP